MSPTGARYGSRQASGRSPTHEEYHEARGTKPVLVFGQTRVTPEPNQEKFIAETGTWEDGGYRQTFDTPASLRRHPVAGSLSRRPSPAPG
jgi:hypothetical protein